MVGNNRFLGGQLVGIGKIKANGELIYNKLEKPIHNRITSVGLDHLFQFAGSTKNILSSSGYMPYLWVGKGGSSSNGYRAGAFHYMAFGTSNTPTQFTDTQLGNIASTYSETRLTNTSDTSGQTLNGTHINSFGNYSFRVSHKSDAVSSDVSVNEIGWFGAYDTTNSYSNKVLFARVVLPAPIVLHSGEYLITTYELNETNDNTSLKTVSNFFNLLDSNGNTLQAQQKIIRYERNSTSLYLAETSEPYISSTGEAVFPSNYSEQNGFEPAYSVYVAGTSYGNFSYNDSYSSASYTNFPNDGERYYYASKKFSDGGGTYSATVDTYNGVGSTNKYRDRIYVVGSMNPGMSDPAGYVDIYNIVLNGMLYRFGYDNNGTWVQQAWRKYANQKVTFTFRTRYSTEDTTSN